MSQALLEHEVLVEMNPSDPDIRVGDVFRHCSFLDDEPKYLEVMVMRIYFDDVYGVCADLAFPYAPNRLRRRQRVYYMTKDLGWELVARKEA